MPKNPKVEDNAKERGLRTFARPDSFAYRVHYAQKKRKDRKEARVSPLLLDTYPGAAAAYSLRQLSSTATNVVRVRRSSDNAEQDFTAAQIEGGTLETFCGSGDGFVTTWYDQSGNGNDATQATAGSQPKIVDNGSLVTENGKAALDFDGVDDFLSAPDDNTLDLSTEFAIFYIINELTALASPYTRHVSKGNSTGSNGAYSFGDFNNTRANLLPAGANSDGQSIRNQGRTLITWVGSSIEEFVSLKKNGEVATLIDVDIFNTPIRNTTDPFTIGDANNERPTNGTFQEIILYPSDQSTSRVGIETNINNHYEIY